MQFPNWIRAALQKTVSFPSPSGPSVGRMQYAPTIGYVRSFEIQMQFPNRVRAILRNTDAIPRLGTCEGSKNGSVYATDGGVWWDVFNTPLQLGTCDLSKYRCDPPTGYVRGFKKWICFCPLRGRLWGVFDTPLQSGTYGTSKNSLVFVPYGAAGWAYSIRPYNRVRAILRNTDEIPQLDTCGPSKNCLIFVTFGAAGWGVFNTPLQPNTCDPSKYRCDFPTEYVWPF